MSVGSVIGRGTRVRGSLRGQGNLDILGRVEGDVAASGDVTLGEEAVVRGNVSGAELRVAGAVQGDLRGSEAVMVEPGARVLGDLNAPRISVAPGALVCGGVRTDGEPSLVPGQRRIGSLARSAAARPAKAAKSEAATEETSEQDGAVGAGAPTANKTAARPPAPVVPALRKGTKAKKKRGAS